MIFKLIKNVHAFFKNRLNSFQKILTVLGCVTGFIAAILLIVTGVAAIPFTGGASLLPLWLGIPIFILLVTGSFGSAGKYVGMSIDTLLEEEKANNEKIATFIGCIIGFIISLLGIPLHFVGLPIIAQNANLSLWKLLFPFIPLTVNAFGSACSKVGKAVDACTNGKTIFDLMRSKKMNENIESMTLAANETHHVSIKKLTSISNVREQLTNHLSRFNKKEKLERGIHYYLSMSQQKNNSFHFFSRYSHQEKGVLRAKAYKALYKHTHSSFQRKVITYSLFASRDGRTLQKNVYQSLGYQSLKAAKEAMRLQIKTELTSMTKMKILNQFVIKPIIVNANTNKSFKSGVFDDALDILKSCDPTIKYRS